MSDKSYPVVLLRFVSILLLLGFLRPDGLAQERDSGEERYIRQTYLKLSLLNQADRKRNATRSTGARRADDALRFTLSNFHTGPIEEILARPMAELATLPSGEIIRATEHSIRETPGSQEEVGYQAHWSAGQYSAGIDPGSYTVGDALKQMGTGYADVGKYTSYEVTVSLDGKQRTYRALLLFHGPFGSVVDARAEFWDAIVGMGGVLTDVAGERRAPAGFRRSARIAEPGTGPDDARPTQRDSPSSIGDQPLVGPIADTYDSCDGIYRICCPLGATGLDECCWDSSSPWGNPGWFPDCRGRIDGSGGGGGGGGGGDDGSGGGGGGGDGGDTEESCPYHFSTGMPVNLFSDGSQGHAEGYDYNCSIFDGFPLCIAILTPAGQHIAATNLHGECVTDTQCRKRCNVVIDSKDVSDWGSTGLLYHVTKEKSTENNDATGHSSVPISCVGGYGYAVDQCLTPFCQISLVVSASASPGGVGIGGGVSVQSTAMWTASHGVTHTCEAR